MRFAILTKISPTKENVLVNPYLVKIVNENSDGFSVITFIDGSTIAVRENLDEANKELRREMVRQ